jgi:hypothetical protein
MKQLEMVHALFLPVVFPARIWPCMQHDFRHVSLSPAADDGVLTN